VLREVESTLSKEKSFLLQIGIEQAPVPQYTTMFSPLSFLKLKRMHELFIYFVFVLLQFEVTVKSLP
jgi:hypothetical protein